MSTFYHENNRDSYLNHRRYHAKCGGGILLRDFHDMKTTERQRISAHIAHPQIENRIPCKMQWFSFTYLLSTQRTTVFHTRLRRFGHRVLMWSTALAKFAKCQRLNGCEWGDDSHTVGKSVKSCARWCACQLSSSTMSRDRSLSFLAHSVISTVFLSQTTFDGGHYGSAEPKFISPSAERMSNILVLSVNRR